MLCCFPKSLHHVTLPSAVSEGTNLPTFFLAHVIICLVITAIFMDVKCISL